MPRNDSKIKRILIAYDGSGYAHAALHELLLSGLPDKAEVIIISVSEIWLPPRYESTEVFPDNDVAEYFQKHHEQAERNAAEAKVTVCQARDELLRYFPDWNTKIEVAQGSPARKILARASEFKPDIIVAGSQGLSSDREVGLGSISQMILHEARCSVRISRLKPERSHSRPRIVIGFDGSRGAMTAIRTVALRPWQTKPEIRILTIVDPFIPLITGRVLRTIPGLSEGRLEGEQKWFQLLAVDALQVLRNAGLSATLNICSGNPRMMLIRETKQWDADAIFLGANSREFQSEYSSIGCVASAITARASCTVEVVRVNR